MATTSSTRQPYPSPISPDSPSSQPPKTSQQQQQQRPTTPAKVKKSVIPPDGALVGRNGRFRLEKTIGQGTYGKVKLATDLWSEGGEQRVAIKIIDKSHITSTRQRSRLEREVSFLKLLHHPHIVSVYDIHETEDCIFIAMEYVGGGELFDYIVANKRVKEKEARAFFRQVLSAVEYCHRNHIIHRDLKPENLLLQITPSPTPGGPDSKTIKIIDFGFGNSFKGPGSGHLLDTFCGSPFYAAPEMILGRKYEGPEVDMWSLGVILFALLCGHLPFDDDNMKELYKKIAQGTYTVPDYLMPDARHLISRLITVDPSKRATLSEVLSHRWVNEGYSHPVPDYSPPRPALRELDPLLVMRMQHLNFTEDDVRSAFDRRPAGGSGWALNAPWESLGEADAEDPHGAPVRCTYYLLKEMIAREEQARRGESTGTGVAKRRGAVVERIDTKGATTGGVVGAVNKRVQQGLPQLPASAPSTPSKHQEAGNSESGPETAPLVRPQTPDRIAQQQQQQAATVNRYGTVSSIQQVGVPSRIVAPTATGQVNKYATIGTTSARRTDVSTQQQQPAGRVAPPVPARPAAAAAREAQVQAILAGVAVPQPAASVPAGRTNPFAEGTWTTANTSSSSSTTTTTTNTSVPVSHLPQPTPLAIPDRLAGQRPTSLVIPSTTPLPQLATRQASSTGLTVPTVKPRTVSSSNLGSPSAKPSVGSNSRMPSFSAPRDREVSVSSATVVAPSTPAPSSPTKRSVTSWFVGTSVYQSRRPKEELVGEVKRILDNFGISYKWSSENDCVFDCEIWDVSAVADNMKQAKKDAAAALSSSSSVATATDSRPSSPAKTAPSSRPSSPIKKPLSFSLGSSSTPRKMVELEFTVEISRAPKQASGAYVLHTRRIHGGNWNYRKIAGKVLDALVL